MNRCSRCGDAIIYCSCERTDPAWSSHPDLMENPSFWIYRGEAEVEWDSRGGLVKTDGLSDSGRQHSHRSGYI